MSGENMNGVPEDRDVNAVGENVEAAGGSSSVEKPISDGFRAQVDPVDAEGTPGGAPDGSDAGRPSTEEQLLSLQDRLLRQAAEFQNFRRRVEQERKNDVKFGQSLVLLEMLDVYDDLRRSIEAAAEGVEQGDDVDSPHYTGLLEGVELVFKKFTDMLQRFGVEPIEAVGQAFDEHTHEAMMQQPAPEGTASGIILGEIQKGYRMGDRVLRHSKVVVSS